MKRTAIVVGVIAAAAVAALILSLNASGKGGGPGIFGPGSLGSDINLILQVVLVLGLTLGFRLARANNIEAHRINQTTWVLVNAVLVALVMAPALKSVKLNSVADLANTGNAVTWLHAAIGAFAVLSGLWLVLQMNDILPRAMHIRRWKTLMRLTLSAYWIMLLLGFATYYLWYMNE